MAELTPAEARVVADTLKVYRRYAGEVVEALGLCPWAAAARRDGEVLERVVLLRTLDVDAVCDVVEEVAAMSEIVIGLLILPLVDADRHGFERFVSRVVGRHSDRSLPEPAPFAMAAFHPEAEPDLTAPARLTPFIRRTPDPTIQLVRHAVLDAVRGRHPQGTRVIDPATVDLEALLNEPVPVPIHDRIARSNLETISSTGVEQVRAILDDIRAERDRLRAAWPDLG